MGKTRFAIIETGLWDVPRNEIIAAETPEVYAENRRHTIPGFCVLIQHEELGNILYDTGIAGDWKETWPEQFKKDYSFYKLESLTAKLAEFNLTVDDIDLLVMSHLHYDHAGNIKLFKGTKAGKKIMISEGEAHEAFVKSNLDASGLSGAYLRSEIIMEGIGYQLINEDTKLCDDVELFLQRGHTPGVIGMIIKTEDSGNFIFASDAIYSCYNFGPPIVLPGLCVDTESYKANIERVSQLKETYNAQIVFGHDVEDFKKWTKSPYFYK